MTRAVQAPQQIAVAVVMAHGKVLVGRRAAPPYAGYAEFPGGKLEQGESPEQAAVRECLEETGIDVVADRVLSETHHAEPDLRLRLTFVLCRLTSHDTDRRREGNNACPVPLPPFEWIDAKMLSRRRFPPANRRVLDDLMQRLADRT